MIFAVLALLAGAGADDVASRARATEEQAFLAVDQQRWCEALGLFLESDGLQPSPDLIFNAAQAAELGADRARAMQLYTQLLGTTTSAERKVEAKARISALTKLVEKQGPGTPCPLPEVAVAPAGPPEPVEVPSTRGVDGAAIGPSAPAAASTVPAPSPWPWLTAGLGGTGVVAGGAVALLGLQPWFAHEAARGALADAEKQGSTEGVERLFADQERARADWSGWGQASVAAGIALVVVGALALGGGVGWGVLEGGAE